MIAIKALPGPGGQPSGLHAACELPRRTRGLVSAALCAALALCATATAQTTERVSVSMSGQEANGGSDTPSVSADGRFIAFSSLADNLVPGDANGVVDVFVHDRQSGQTERVSVSSEGAEGVSDSATPSISADGRFIAFTSSAANLIPDDTNNTLDVFVHDRQAGLTERISVSAGAVQGNNHSLDASISADGRFVSFASFASNLVPGDSNGSSDIFVIDRLTGLVERVSVASDGKQGNDLSRQPSISDDGRFVAFRSSADNLVADDANNDTDVFVYDRQTGLTERVSVSSAGQGGNSASESPSISGDGRFVAFVSLADNLTPGDANNTFDAFVHDRQTRSTERVSVSSSGQEADGLNFNASISTDGRFVAYASIASNLVPGDANGLVDVFIHDRQSSVTERVSVSSAGEESDGLSETLSVSANGRFIAFGSLASNLVPGDANGALDVFVRDRQETTLGDLTGDRLVSGEDLGLLLGYWGPCSSTTQPCPADLNGDGIVDGADLGSLLGNWGPAQ